MYRFLPLFLLILSLSCPAAEHDAVRRAVEKGQYKPLAEILEAVEKQCPGRILDVDLERDRSGHMVYEVKSLGRDGQRCVFHFDATSGALLERGRLELDVKDIRPLPGILRKVLARHPGYIIDVELERGDKDRLIYEIKVSLLDGRLRELSVDAVSGEFIDGEEGREAVPQALKPLPDIIDALQSRYPGVVVTEAELERTRSGNYFYEIEIRMADGNMLDVDVDALSGEVIREEVSDG